MIDYDFLWLWNCTEAAISKWYHLSCQDPTGRIFESLLAKSKYFVIDFFWRNAVMVVSLKRKWPNICKRLRMLRQKQRFHASPVCRRRWFSCLMVVPRNTASKSSRGRNMKVASPSGVMLWWMPFLRKATPITMDLLLWETSLFLPSRHERIDRIDRIDLGFPKNCTPWREVALVWQPCRCYGACKTLGTYCWPMMRRMRRQNGWRWFHQEWADQ